jgi:mono/diheme cytochrome c family protein
MTMRRTLMTGIALIVAALAGVALDIWVSNLLLLDHRFAVVPVAAPSLSGASVDRGRHLADITGCTDCHRDDLRGYAFDDEGWWHGRYYAANLTLKARDYSDADLARILRFGVRPDGRGVMAMPSFGFVRLRDEELRDIIAFIRQFPAGGAEQPAHHIGPLDQWALWRGSGPKPAIAYVALERSREPPDAGAEHEAGRYLAGIVCAECHGGDLTGNGWDSGAPDMIVVRAYSLEALTRLLRTGTKLNGSTGGLMSEVAQNRLRKLTDDEIARIHGYLLARAQRREAAAPGS